MISMISYQNGRCTRLIIVIIIIIMRFFFLNKVQRLIFAKYILIVLFRATGEIVFFFLTRFDTNLYFLFATIRDIRVLRRQKMSLSLRITSKQIKMIIDICGFRSVDGGIIFYFPSLIFLSSRWRQTNK